VLPDERRDLMVVALAVMLLACAAVRVAGLADPGPIELVPVIAAAWWFGRRAALIVTAIASVALIVSAAVDAGFEPWTVVIRIALLALAAQVVGVLHERLRAQDAELDRLRPLHDVLAPRQAPELPLLEVASHYAPAQAGVSGDFYLVVEGPNAATVIVVGDVAGKGIEAARRATFVRSIVTACAPYSEDPAGILRIANAELIRQYGPSPTFITMLCAVIRPDGALSWASAGHPPPVALSDGHPLGAPEIGFPLGIAPEIPDLGVDRLLLPAEGILLFTDGLTDARPAGGRFQPFGDHRIGMFLRDLEAPTPQEAVDALSEAALRFAGGKLPDDMCLVAVRSKLERRFVRSSVAERREEHDVADRPTAG
jgi:serine phosphatase RsbU (regulator of sigma subunit)